MRGTVTYALPFLLALSFFVLPTSIVEPLQLTLVSMVASRQAPELSPQQAAPPSFAAWSETENQEEEEAFAEADLAVGSIHPFLVANVIFQPSAPWSNSLWIDAGSSSENLPFPLAKNCPVLIQDVVVGMVDFVGKKASRVRLISDPSLHLAVRVVRGNKEAARIIAAVHDLQEAVKKYPGLLPKPEFASTLHKLLECIPGSIQAENVVSLAKGELQGADHPARPGVLRGIGFNYDFSDEDGEKRDLRSGQRSLTDPKTLLIKPGDLLETSGLDGVFPRGLRVATVSTVFPLDEGAIFYQILARTEAKGFPNFDFITVIPAQPDEPLHPHSSQEQLLQHITEACL